MGITPGATQDVPHDQKKEIERETEREIDRDHRQQNAERQLTRISPVMTGASAQIDSHQDSPAQIYAKDSPAQTHDARLSSALVLSSSLVEEYLLQQD